MKITRKNPITGFENTLDIPVNPEDYIAWSNGLAPFDELMPYVSQTHKEFILSGLLEGDWKKVFEEV